MPRSLRCRHAKRNMKLIVGLGNPGSQYTGTRHNVGFEVVDRLARRWADRPADGARNRFGGLVVEATVGQERALLLKPLTFMNRSGRAVAEAVGFYKIDVTRDLLVVADDLDLACGIIRLRAEGGSGGHNGLQDILGALGRPDWARCRVGIGRSTTIPSADYVLGRFTPEQQPAAEESFDQAASACEAWCRDGIASSMNTFNRKPATTSEPLDRS